MAARACARDLAQRRMEKMSHDDAVTCDNILQTPLDQKRRGLLENVFSLMGVVGESWKVGELYALWHKVVAGHDCVTDAVTTPPRSAFPPSIVTQRSTEEQALFDAFGQEDLLDVFFAENSVNGGEAYEHYVRTQLHRGQVHHLSIESLENLSRKKRCVG